MAYYQHYAVGTNLDINRKKEVAQLILVCISNGPKRALRHRTVYLARPVVKRIVDHIAKDTNGKARPIVLGRRDDEIQYPAEFNPQDN
jgi:hypothetical protein